MSWLAKQISAPSTIWGNITPAASATRIPNRSRAGGAGRVSSTNPQNSSPSTTIDQFISG